MPEREVENHAHSPMCSRDAACGHLQNGGEKPIRDMGTASAILKDDMQN
jgi:hypothetical protein